jgi:transcriptional regulator with XRE-family HTH domain
MDRKPKRTITEADELAAEELKKIWDRKRQELSLTQEKAAQQFGGTQGLISQYLLGRIALGRIATLKFARILQVAPEEIRPDFEYSAVLPDDMPADVIRMAYQLAAMPEIMRRDIERTINLYSAAKNYPAFLQKLELAEPRKPAKNT